LQGRQFCRARARGAGATPAPAGVPAEAGLVAGQQGGTLARVAPGHQFQVGVDE